MSGTVSLPSSTIAPVFCGSNHGCNFRLLSVAPLPVHETLNLPYQSGLSGPYMPFEIQFEYPPCNCPITLRLLFIRGEPDDPPSVTPFDHIICQ